MTPSILIIGAGAAGLAAGRVLHDAGHEVLILEARDRIGGRIHTDYEFADIPVELGAEFIHGERAVTHDLVRQAGLTTWPVVRMGSLWWAEDGTPAVRRDKLPPVVKQQLEGLLTDYDGLVEADLPQDMPLAHYLSSRGWDEQALEMADVLLAQTCCADLESLSCYDLIHEMRVEHAGHDEARIGEGYGALLDWYSRGLPIRLNTPVSDIRWNADRVTVAAGNTTFEARKCIVAVPVSVLQQGMIHFDPPLSEEKRRAIDSLGFEPATKLIYRFREVLWNRDLTFMAHPGLAARWWTAHSNAPVISCYVTADRARKIDAMDETAALSAGMQDLSGLLAIPLATLRGQLIAGRRVSWAHDPYTLGGYAHIPSRAAEARPLLAQPEGGVLFFAGEATAYDTNPQTVHGAIESGWRAARECMARL